MFAGEGWSVRESAQAAGIPLVRRAVGASALSVYVPAHPDALLEALTEEEFRASDERLPYFSTLWPAGESLALAGAPAEGLDGRLGYADADAVLTQHVSSRSDLPVRG